MVLYNKIFFILLFYFININCNNNIKWLISKDNKIYKKYNDSTILGYKDIYLKRIYSINKKNKNFNILNIKINKNSPINITLNNKLIWYNKEYDDKEYILKISMNKINYPKNVFIIHLFNQNNIRFNVIDYVNNDDNDFGKLYNTMKYNNNSYILIISNLNQSFSSISYFLFSLKNSNFSSYIIIHGYLNGESFLLYDGILSFNMSKIYIKSNNDYLYNKYSIIFKTQDENDINNNINNVTMSYSNDTKETTSITISSLIHAVLLIFIIIFICIKTKKQNVNVEDKDEPFTDNNIEIDITTTVPKMLNTPNSVSPVDVNRIDLSVSNDNINQKNIFVRNKLARPKLYNKSNKSIIPIRRKPEIESNICQNYYPNNYYNSIIIIF